MMKKTMMTAALTMLIVGQAWAEDAPKIIAEWPPISVDKNAAQNWPIPHPVPAINLNEIPSGIAFRAMTKKDRKGVQIALSRVGLYAGKIDGAWGPNTFMGVKMYADEVNLSERLNTPQGSIALFRHIAN